jgi:hypothetical protein
MKQFIRKYNQAYKASLMLLVVYSIHLFAFQVLLSNPYDLLSAFSFDDYKTKPDKTSNCLLLLAKKQVTKQSAETESFDFTYSPIHTPFVVHSPVTSVIRILQCLSDDSYKLYRLISVFRI